MSRKKYRAKNTGYPSIDQTHLAGFSHKELDPTIPPVSISTAIDLISFGHMRAPLVNQRDLTVTRGEYIKDSKMVAKALLQLGVREGDIVVVFTPNLYQSLVVFKAANRIGAITTFLNNEASDEELIKYLKNYNAPILVTYDQTKDFAQQIIHASPVRYVINIDKSKVDSREQVGLPKIKDNFVAYHHLESIADKWSYRIKYLQKDARNKEALILYTSGSTGEPKSMVFTNENVLAALTYLKYSTHAKPYAKDSFWWLGVVPFMYPYGFICSVMVPLLGGFGARLAPDMGAETLNYYFAKDSQVICGSPALIDTMFQSLDDDVRIPSLNTFLSGGDFLSAQTSCKAMIFFRKHGAKHATVCNGSGNGEILGCATNAMGYDYRPETVGKLILGPQYLVVDENNEEVKYGEPGELLVSGKHVFKEYYKNPKKTAEVTQHINNQRFYCTGNYGSMDEDRYFTFVGRASRFYINSAFKKVYCGKVQRAVAMLSEVRECAVVPMSDKKMRFVSKAFIVLQKGTKASKALEKQIIDQLEHSLNRADVELKDYEIPRDITFIDKLPRTHADKIDYELLRKRVEDKSD